MAKKTAQITLNILMVGPLERVFLAILLPNEGSYEENIAKRELRKELDLTTKELEKYEFKSLPNGKGGINYHVNELGGKDKKKIHLSKITKDMLKEVMKKLSEEKKLPEILMDVYPQIVN